MVELGGLALVVVSAVLMLMFPLFKRYFLKKTALRVLPPVNHLLRAVGLAVEDGKRLHISLGNSSVINPDSASAFAGMNVLERVTQSSMVSDRPPLATSGDGMLALLSQDTLRAVYRAGNALDQYNPDLGRLGGITPLSYTAGAISAIHDERISAHVFIGNFGPEVAFLNEAAEQEKAFVMAASDSLPAQAVLYATAKEPLIGEELFALPGYLKPGTIFHSSVLVQDILRWIVIAILIIGAMLKFLGII